jgi:hypothetical protein
MVGSAGLRHATVYRDLLAGDVGGLIGCVERDDASHFLGRAFPTVASSVMRSVSPEQSAIASGISNTFRQIGAVFGVEITTAVFTTTGSDQTPSSFVNGYSPAFIVLGTLSAPSPRSQASPSSPPTPSRRHPQPQFRAATLNRS